MTALHNALHNWGWNQQVFNEQITKDKYNTYDIIFILMMRFVLFNLVQCYHEIV